MHEKQTEESLVVDFDVFYADSVTNPNMKPGWYFWFLDQHQHIVSEPIGPFTLDEVYRAGKIAVLVYYDE